MHAIRRLQVIHRLTVFALIGYGLNTNVNLFERLTKGKEVVSFANPTFPEKLIFTMFDWIHLWKNVRNSFANKTLHFYDFETRQIKKWAKWEHLTTVYHAEKENVIKMAPKLNHQAIFPSNFVR